MIENLNVVTEVLAELCELLETYAPSWYTQEHSNKAQAALRLLAQHENAGRASPSA